MNVIAKIDELMSRRNGRGEPRATIGIVSRGERRSPNVTVSGPRTDDRESLVRKHRPYAPQRPLPLVELEPAQPVGRFPAGKRSLDSGPAHIDGNRESPGAGAAMFWSHPHESRHRPHVRVTPGGAAGVAVLALLLFTAFVAPHLDGTDPAHQALRARLAPPVGFGGAWTHPLGTDGLGRDLLARVIAGARISLLIGVAATLASGAAGVALGLLAGFFGGWVDRIITFAADVQLALPFVIVAIALAATLGAGIRNVILVLTITGWVGFARILRLQTMALRRAPFIEAARSTGAGSTRIVLRHLAPNLVAPVTVIASQQVAAMILFEAALSYLGLGAGPATVTWGGMISAGRETMLTAWWVTVVPGAAVALTILGLNLLGDWLRGVMDPTTRGR